MQKPQCKISQAILMCNLFYQSFIYLLTPFLVLNLLRLVSLLKFTTVLKFQCNTMRVIMRPNVHIQPDPFFFIWWSLRYYNIHDTCQPTTIMQKCFNSSSLYQSLETSILFCWPSYDGTTEKKKYIFEQFLSEVHFVAQANFDLRTPILPFP